MRTQVTLAADLRTSQQNISNWQTGKTRPSAMFRALIERLYGIPSTDWLLAREREFLASVEPSNCVTTPMPERRAVG